MSVYLTLAEQRASLRDSTSARLTTTMQPACNTKKDTEDTGEGEGPEANPAPAQSNGILLIPGARC